MFTLNSTSRLIIAIFIPVLAAVVQWSIWAYIPPLTWLLFYPAVFFSAWVGGFRGGLIATLFAAVLGIYFFIPPQLSFIIENNQHIISIAVFSTMGVLFSVMHGCLQLPTIPLIFSFRLNSTSRLIIAVFIPVLAAVVQWSIWAYIPPLTWLLFYPAIFFSAWVGGFRGGLIATLFAAVLGIYFFIPPQLSFIIQNNQHSLSIAVFFTMGVLFSVVHGRLQSIQAELKRINHLDAVASKARLLSALESANAGLWEWDIQTNRNEWSDNIWKLYNVDANSEANFDTWANSVHPEDRDKTISQLAEAVKAGIEITLEWRVANLAAGEERWLMSRGKLEQNADGLSNLYRGLVLDITDRKLTENALRERERQLDFALTTLSAGAWDLDLKTHIATRTLNHAQIFGYSDIQTEWSSQKFLEHVLPEDKEVVAQKIKAAIQAQCNLNFECRIRRTDGEIRWLNVRSRIHFDEQDHGVSMSGIVQDITERKQEQMVVIKQAQLLELAHDAIIVKDMDGKITYWNKGAEEHYGWSSQEALGQLAENFLKTECSEPLEIIAKQLFTQDRWQGELTQTKKNGSKIIVASRWQLQKENDLPVAVFKINNDITLQKQNEFKLKAHHDELETLVENRTHELIAAREEAERLSQVKGAFIANMSHEIRTPMNAILGFCYLLAQRPLDDETHLLINKIHGAGRLLLALINDILDFSKIESGRLDIEYIPFQLYTMLDNIVSLMSASAKDKNLELVISPPINVNTVICDEIRLQQVLVNLLSNAIKFTHQGEVVLFIDIEAEDEQQVTLKFSVRDTGIGISEAMQKEIFTAFTQADTSINRRFGGTGLGLSISRQLIKLMGGTLQVKSEAGCGSEFWFSLTMQRDLQAENTTPSLTNLRLLVADDSATAREALTRTVRCLGWNADAVDSGAAAVAQVLSHWERYSPYDVILLDWKMPEQDGLETAENIKKKMAENTSNPHTPIIIMATAYSLNELLAHPRMVFVDALLNKPVSPSALFNSISEAISRRTDAKRELRTKLADVQHILGVRILVVDDSEINREVAQRILESEGANVSLANDGQDALDWLSLHSHEVDIILMDVQMPIMNGYEATKRIRQNPHWKSLPIVALTAGAFKNLQDAVYEAGMDDFISKPFDVERLIKVIQLRTGHILENATAPLAHSHANSTTDSYASSLNDVVLAGIDIVSGVQRFGQIANYKIYLNKFIENYANAGQMMCDYIAQHDVAAARALAHKLVGVAGNLALNNVATHAAELDRLLASGASITADKLQNAIDEACTSIIVWTKNDAEIEDSQDVPAPIVHSAELIDLLNQLINALDEQNFEIAESILSALQEKLPSTVIAQIRLQLDNFDFHAAQMTIKELLKQLSS